MRRSLIVGPIDVWILAGFLLAFLAGTLLVGLPLLRVATRWRLLPSPENPLVAVFLMMGLFSISIPILALTLSPLRAFGNVAAFLFLIGGGSMLLLLWRRSPFEAWQQLFPRTPEVNIWFPLLLLVGSAVIRFAPTLGLYVYPADDPTLYTILTQVLLAHGGPSFDLGWLEPFTQPPHPYPYMFGFASLAGFPSLLLDYHPSLTVTLTTLLYSCLLPLAIYSLAIRLFDKKVALAAMAMAAFVVHIPMDFFNWGGNAETVGYFFAVFTVYLLSPLFHPTGPPSSRSFVLPGVAMASGALVHPFAISYVLLFLPVPLVVSLYRRNRRAVVQTGMAIGTALAILLPVLIAFGLNEWAQSAAPAGPLLLFGEPSIRYEEVLLSWSGLSPDFLSFYLRFLPVAILAAVALMAFDVARGRSRVPLLLVAGWGGLLLALHENSPHGLYLIPYPLWTSFSPPRFIFAFVALPVALAMGYMAERAVEILRRPAQSRSAFAGFLMASILLSVSILQVGSTYAALQAARENSPVAEEDIVAFQWIQANLPEDAWFYVNNADAGPWLFQYTGRRTFPSRMLMNDADVVRDYRRLDALVYQDPGDPEALELMGKYGIGAVYFGGKPVRLFDDRRQPDLDLFLQYPSTFVQVYEDRGVYIFLTDLRDMREFIVELQNPWRVTPKRVILAVDGATVSLRGPLTVELALYRGPVEDPSNLDSVEVIRIGAGETWTFTLREHEGEVLGDWNAVVRLISIDD